MSGKTTARKKTRTYQCVVHYEGGIRYSVEAKDKAEAEEKAMELFEDESPDTLANRLGDIEVCDCWEGDR